ncbi:hypothetical protein [Algicella marina]|uniref:Nucleotidyltransferase family protein n=1 Tax=Algicella marina TaxID=2683284 RepID=A0A6P1SZM1_9RHOB|nr:hypothetical protein [Algicella marina]QHQ34489.1 hypothetical protein GO499_04445 [Algicella marina]
MERLHPSDRPVLQAEALIAVLAAHEVRWVLCGSQVLALHGAKLVPNDLDVVPELSPENLARVAECLRSLNAVRAYLDGWGGATLAECEDWRVGAATAEALDWLYVTPLGMLDIVVEFAAPYAELMQGAIELEAAGVPYRACDPRKVLRALERRDRSKDAARRAEYARLRRELGVA